ncbi:hypothetical protein P3L10_029600 [Capsicum annuum]
MSDTPSLVVGSPDTPGSIDILIGSSSSLSITRRLVILVVGEKLVPNGHSISKTIIENFKEQQDATGYTWKGVIESTRKFYWHELMKSYQWNPTENSIIECTWKKVAANLYTKRTYHWRREASGEFKNKSYIGTQNRCSETGGLGTGPSKHTSGSRSTVEHTIKLINFATEMGCEPNSWKIFKKLHQKKDDSFVDAKSKSINDKMEAVIATALLGSSDDSSEDQELDINSMYFDVAGGAKRRCVYELGSEASALYKDHNFVKSANLVSDHVAEERIKILEKEVSQMRENQERVLQERVKMEVQHRVEQEVFRLRKQSDDRFKSMEEQWSRMMSDMTLSSRLFSYLTLPNRDSSNA